MKKFEKLSRTEMKKINGGVPPACNTDNSCVVYIPNVGTLFATCSNTSGCVCSREFNGTTYYGNSSYCMSVS